MRKRRKNAAVRQISHDLKGFLAEREGLRFYALALDCNTEYGSLLLCMNTPECFERTLRRYQQRYEKYQEEIWIQNLRYNPGDWDYTDISQVDLFDEEASAQWNQDDGALPWGERMALCEEILEELRRTPVFSKIPKTPDFISFCIDHDEDVGEALERQRHSIAEKGK